MKIIAVSQTRGEREMWWGRDKNLSQKEGPCSELYRAFKIILSILVLLKVGKKPPQKMKYLKKITSVFKRPCDVKNNEILKNK